MKPHECYVGFHPRHRPITGWFGHVELWGYTIDETWFFLDPQGKKSTLLITHLHDEVELQLAARFELCETILRLSPNDRTLIPLHLPMTCAGIVGHHFGVRALTPAGLKRRLLAIGAEIVHDAKRGPGRESGA